MAITSQRAYHNGWLVGGWFDLIDTKRQLEPWRRGRGKVAMTGCGRELYDTKPSCAGAYSRAAVKAAGHDRKS